jgi:hypothetical protein
MKNWLHVRNIPFCDTMLKVQHCDLIKAYKLKYKTFLVGEEIMTANGHTVLRLPPYHPDLHPIELIWADVKQRVGGKKELGQMSLNIFARSIYLFMDCTSWWQTTKHRASYSLLVFCLNISPAKKYCDHCICIEKY